MNKPSHFVRFMAMLVCIAFPVGSAFAKTVKYDSPSQIMTLREAKRALAGALAHLNSTNLVGRVRISRQGVAFVAENRSEDSKGNYHDVGIPSDHAFKFGDMTELALESGIIVRQGRRRLFINGSLVFFNQRKAAQDFVDAVLTLKKAALATDPEEADFAAFARQAQDWQQVAEKPAMSDEVRTCRLLAEDAFKQKDFDAALDAYGEALDRFPFWPEGQYNAALLAAETEDYELAAHHMRRYLALAPDAPDAAAAKDKLLLWQHKAKQ